MSVIEAKPTPRRTPVRAPSALASSAGFVLSAVIFLLVWEGVVRYFAIPAYLLPAPSAVFLQVYTDVASGLIFPHFWTTFLEVVLGFLLATALGLSIGSAVALIPVVERVIYPYVLILQTVPKIAVAPLFLIWFGYGFQSKVITAALVAFFPILVNVIAGLKTVDPSRLQLMRALKASPMQTFMKVRLPSMLPYLFAGLEVAIIFSLIGAIVGEFIGASEGLGSLIIQRQGAVNVAGVFSILIFLSLMGLGLNAVLRLAARRFAFWSRPSAPEAKP